MSFNPYLTDVCLFFVQIIINIKVPALKWGFVHLIATMLADYINMIIFEAYEGFVHGAESHSEGSHGVNHTTEAPHLDLTHHIQKRATGCK